MFDDEDYGNQLCDEIKIKPKEEKKINTLNDWVKDFNKKVDEKREKEKKMTEKQYSKGIYVKKFTGKYGEWLSIAIKKEDGTYDNYKFYPKKEQKNDKYIEFYGVIDDYKKEENNGTEEVPF